MGKMVGHAAAGRQAGRRAGRAGWLAPILPLPLTPASGSYIFADGYTVGLVAVNQEAHPCLEQGIGHTQQAGEGRRKVSSKIIEV